MGEAQASVNQLTNLVERLFETSQDMVQRMARLEMLSFGHTPCTAPTIFTTDGDFYPTEVDEETNSDEESYLTVRRLDSALQTLGTDDAKSTFRFTFDQDLSTSRPYTRAMKRPPPWSARSSAIGTSTVGWSFLSGFSLADVSEISIINLPISSRVLWNGQRYSDSVAVSKDTLEGTTEEHRARTASRQVSGSESGQEFESRTRSESRMRSISRLGSISVLKWHTTITSLK